MNNIREILLSIGEAIIQHMIYSLETKGKYPLDRATSRMLKSYKTEVEQGRNSKGQFEGFTPNNKLLPFIIQKPKNGVLIDCVQIYIERVFSSLYIKGDTSNDGNPIYAVTVWEAGIRGNHPNKQTRCA